MAGIWKFSILGIRMAKLRGKTGNRERFYSAPLCLAVSKIPQAPESLEQVTIAGVTSMRMYESSSHSSVSPEFLENDFNDRTRSRAPKDRFYERRGGLGVFYDCPPRSLEFIPTPQRHSSEALLIWVICRVDTMLTQLSQGFENHSSCRRSRVQAPTENSVMSLSLFPIGLTRFEKNTLSASNNLTVRISSQHDS